MGDKPQIFVGLDLGQRRDYSAVVAAEKRMVDWEGSRQSRDDSGAVKVAPAGSPVVIAHGHAEAPKAATPTKVRSQYQAVHVQQFPLETPYPSIVEKVAGLFARPQFAGQTLAVDQTGVGAPVVDTFRAAKRDPVRCPKCHGEGSTNLCACMTCGGKGRLLLDAKIVPIQITGGVGWRVDDRGAFHVSKRELISVLLVLMEDPVGRFVIDPRLPHARTLVDELGKFRAKKNERTGNDTLEAWREGDKDDLVLAAAMMLWCAERASRKAWFKC